MTSRTVFIDKDDLYQRYIIEEYSVEDLMQIYHCSPIAIIRNLREHNIKIRGEEAKHHTKRSKEKRKLPQNTGYISKETLEYEYITEHRNIKNIAQLHHCSRGKIKHHLIKYKIINYNIRPTLNIPKDELEYKYCTLLETTSDIASYYNCSVQTICNWMNKYAIPLRTYHTSKKIPKIINKLKCTCASQNLTADKLYQHYIIEQQTLGKIANIYKCYISIVRLLMHNYNIPIRCCKEMQTIESRKIISEKVNKYLQTPLGLINRQRFGERSSKLLKGKRGAETSNWQGGASFYPYSPEFTKELRLLIHVLYDYTCQFCGVKYTLGTKPYPCIHHIDSNKLNCKLDNLIPLCNYCHAKTVGKYSRIYYQSYFTTLKELNYLPKQNNLCLK
jgi:hypothetical protein